MQRSMARCSLPEDVPGCDTRSRFTTREYRRHIDQSLPAAVAGPTCGRAERVQGTQLPRRPIARQAHRATRRSSDDGRSTSGETPSLPAMHVVTRRRLPGDRRSRRSGNQYSSAGPVPRLLRRTRNNLAPLGPGCMGPGTTVGHRVEGRPIEPTVDIASRDLAHDQCGTTPRCSSKERP